MRDVLKLAILSAAVAAVSAALAAAIVLVTDGGGASAVPPAKHSARLTERGSEAPRPVQLFTQQAPGGRSPPDSI